MKIAVVGLGAIGAQVLWHLSKRSEVEVYGFESGYIGHPNAGAGGESRLFRNLELTAEGYIPIIRRADELWRELEADSGHQLRRPTGVLLIGEESSHQIEQARSTAQKWDLPNEVYGADELRKRFPQFSIRDSDIAIWDALGGVIAPELTIATTVEQATSKGASVASYTAVADIHEGPNGVRLTLASGEQQYFDRAVIACGGWTTQLVPELNDWIVTRRLTSAWYAPRDVNSLRDLPPFMQTAPGYCYGIPTQDKQLVKLGLGFNDHLPLGDPNQVPRALTHEDAREQVEKFAWILRDLLPGLLPNPIRMQTFIESYTRSMREYMAYPPGHVNTLVLAGFSGHGFKMAPALGELGAQLALEGRTDLDLKFLSEAQPVFSITDVSTGTTTHNSIMASHD